MTDETQEQQITAVGNEMSASFLAAKKRSDATLAKLEEQKADLEAQMAAHDPSDYEGLGKLNEQLQSCLLYTSPSPRD